MVFASMLFVFLFLVANLASQIALRNPRGKNIAMLVFSLVFYAWSGPRYLLLLMGMVLICWLGALLVESTGRPKLWLGVTVGLCLAIINLLGATAMAGAVGAGGLGAVALTYGYQNFNQEIMYSICLILIILVALIQYFGDWIYKKLK